MVFSLKSEIDNIFSCFIVFATPQPRNILHYTLHTTHYSLHTTHYSLHTTHYSLLFSTSQLLNFSTPQLLNLPTYNRSIFFQASAAAARIRCKAVFPQFYGVGELQPQPYQRPVSQFPGAGIPPLYPQSKVASGSRCHYSDCSDKHPHGIFFAGIALAQFGIGTGCSPRRHSVVSRLEPRVAARA